ncbi:MAG TPA: sigma-54 dependent transcriptional regulator [Terriglobia bacterium]|nr:sigma-54 dependent transcriptional regulator [Terriglobia bacterium]
MSQEKSPIVLVVEDDAENRVAMLKVLEGAGYRTREADNGQEGLDRILEENIDILVSDLRLPVMDGVELLKRAKAADQDLEVILITGHGTVEVAVEAIKEGAYDFITKPVKRTQLLRAVEKAAEKQSLQRENKELRSKLSQNDKRFVYASAGMRDIARVVEQVASSTATVLITGESGVGKEVVADAIHAASPRRSRPLIKVSCAALPETLLEAELFGYEKGAFTGANARKEGRFELANGGALFLDEIGEISPAVQVKLLRVLQGGKFERLGGTRTIDVDVRILAATNKDLQKEVEEKRFREDLFYRLNVINIHIPPLRERKDDVQALAMHFLKTYADKNQKIIDGFSEEAMLALTSYDWPGNVRELENAIERAVVFTNLKLVPLSALPQNVSAFGDSRHSLTFRIGTPLRELERRAIDITLQHTRGDKNMAARLLGIAARTIYRHLEREQAGNDDVTVEEDTEETGASLPN